MDLRKSKYILPNLFTLASVFFGLVAITSCFQGTEVGFKRAVISILVAMVADGLDGRVARMTRTQTRLGIQLDSLADIVSFGVAPAILAYAFVLGDLDRAGGYIGVIPAFVYLGCGALRLARFNVMADTPRKGTGYFTGLPIPAAAGIVVLLIWSAMDLGLSEQVILTMVPGVLLATGALMVSTLRYRSFKQVSPGMGPKVAMVLSAAAIILVAVKTQASVVLFVLAVGYLLLGPAEWLVHLLARARRAWFVRDPND
jgi:CDP-diacylglycerol--serine O-phosphatidyltransferase